MNLKFSIKKKLTNKENQPKINKSEIKFDSSSSLENQNIQKFDKDEEQEWKKAPMDGENELDKEKDLVIDNSNFKNNKIDPQLQRSEIVKDALFSNEIYLCKFCNEKLDKDWKNPHWKWNIDNNIKICSNCYNLKEKEYQRYLNYCNICNSKLKFIRYNPKPEWKMQGQLCRKCWDIKNNDFKSKHLNRN